MKSAFDHIVREHGQTVLRMTRSMLPPADADDAWSETFLAALRAYPGLPPDANVEAWLVTIARRKATDIMRTAARHATPTDTLPDGLSRIGIPDAVRRAASDGIAGLRHAYLSSTNGPNR